MKKGAAFFLTLVAGIAGAAAGAGFVSKKMSETIEKKDGRINKFKNYFDVTNQWIELKNAGRGLEEYFEKNGWHHIAVYGMGELGNRLVEELKNSKIVIEYAIDKRSDMVFSEVELKEMDEELPKVDAIVVTPFFDYDKIEETLMEIVDYPIVSIEEVVFSL